MGGVSREKNPPCWAQLLTTYPLPLLCPTFFHTLFTLWSVGTYPYSYYQCGFQKALKVILTTWLVIVLSTTKKTTPNNENGLAWQCCPIQWCITYYLWILKLSRTHFQLGWQVREKKVLRRWIWFGLAGIFWQCSPNPAQTQFTVTTPTEPY